MSPNTHTDPRESPNVTDQLVASAAHGSKDQHLVLSDSDFEEESAPRPGRWKIPAILLILTLISMTWAGIVGWSPAKVLTDSYGDGSLFLVRRNVLANWIPGLLFSISLATILGAHELGHYFATRFYRIQSTLPLFIPFPINPIGTCGAVILMDGAKADRRQIFDIGIAGPIAGMLIAIPVAAMGMQYGTPPWSQSSSIQFGQPLLIQWLAEGLAPELNANAAGITNEAMNPLLMAAWVGMLVTGLNMMPIGQLDGGHVIFGLMGKSSRWCNWVAYLGAVGYVIYAAGARGQPEFLPMVLLIPLMGITHPPTDNDEIQIGVLRMFIGTLTLILPILCIPAHPFLLLD